MDDVKVMSFIDEVNKEKSRKAASGERLNDPVQRQRVINKHVEDATGKCLNYIFVDLYKNSLPLDSSYVNENDEKLNQKCKDFINKSVADGNIVTYVRECIKNGNQSMKELYESVDRYVKAYYREMTSDDHKINPEDLDFKLDDAKRSVLDDFSADANLDEVSKYIQQNVVDVTEYEKERIKQRKEEMDAMKEELKADPEVTNEAVMNRKLSLRYNKEAQIYQPGLFEGIFIHTVNENPSMEMINSYNESVAEFTLHNVSKALRFKEYSLPVVNKLAKEYARN